MANQNRRDFLKTAGIVAGSVLGVENSKVQAAPQKIISDNRMGVLVDTTLCIGCRRCEFACKNAHDFETGSVEEYDDRSVFQKFRRPETNALTVVNEFRNEEDVNVPIDVKVQCMHCDHPACLSACIVGAFSKQENGAVIWDSDKCIGCRYCMVACPFQVPAFEYDKAIQPEIRKCDFCFDRTKDGGIPACVEICPMETLIYGKRYELVKLAHERIEKNPDRYVNHVYGEKEVGGTSWMYLAPKEFDTLAFPKLKEDPAPGASESLQHAIFSYFVPPVSLFALLGGIMWLGKKSIDSEAGE